MWRMYMKGLPLNDKPINASRGYLIQCAVPSTITITGRMQEGFYASPIIQPGWNSLSMMYVDMNLTNATAESLGAYLLQQYPQYTTISIATWDGRGWKIYRTGLPVNRFTIARDGAYFILGQMTTSQARSASIPAFQTQTLK